MKEDLNNITSLLKQTYPMVLVDKVVNCTKDEVVARKYITNSDLFMQGHFKDFKVYPVVLLIEFMAQSATFPIYNRLGTIDNIWFLSVDRCHCHGFLVPGDIAVSKVKVEAIDDLGMIKCKGVVENDEEEKIITSKFTLIKKDIQN